MSEEHFPRFDVEPGLLIYHTTADTFAEFLHKAAWFTPYLHQAMGYRKTVLSNQKVPRTIACKVIEGKFIQDDDPFLEQVVREVFGEDCDVDPLYSKFCKATNEYDHAEIDEFIHRLMQAGHAGCVHWDYDSHNPENSAYTMIVFEPQKTLKIVSEF